MKKRVILFAIIMACMVLGVTSCRRDATNTGVEAAMLPASVFDVLPTSTYIAEEPQDIYEYENYNNSKYKLDYKPYNIYQYDYPCEYYEYCEYPPPHRPMIALTFDDGPSRYTDYILDILERYGARATFCVLGMNVAAWPDTILRTVELGSEVVGHSWNHPDMTLLGEDAIRRQIIDTSAAIKAITGEPPPAMFRPPYGSVNARVRRVAEGLGYSTLNWTVDPEDWRNRDAQLIYQHIMDRTIDGSIILLHDIRRYTVEAMEIVIPALIEQGFLLVTASELIEYVYGDMVPGWNYRGLRPGERPVVREVIAEER